MHMHVPLTECNSKHEEFYMSRRTHLLTDSAVVSLPANCCDHSRNQTVDKYNLFHFRSRIEMISIISAIAKQGL